MRGMGPQSEERKDLLHGTRGRPGRLIRRMGKGGKGSTKRRGKSVFTYGKQTSPHARGGETRSGYFEWCR